MKGGLLIPDKLRRVKDLFDMLPRIIIDTEELGELKPALEELLAMEAISIMIIWKPWGSYLIRELAQNYLRRSV